MLSLTTQKLSTSGLPIKIITLEAPTLEVDYLWNGWVKRDGVNANLSFATGLTLDTPIDFAVSFRVNIFNGLHFFELPKCLGTKVTHPRTVLCWSWQTYIIVALLFDDCIDV